MAASKKKSVRKNGANPAGLTFEQAMAELEALVSNMEKGEDSLEASLKDFERGVELTRICQQALKDAEQKVQILSQKMGQDELVDFEEDEL